jgi:hypothetical protein
VRRAEISRDNWAVRVVDKAHPLGQLIAAQAGAMRRRHLAQHRHLAATDQPPSGNGLVGGALPPGGDARDAVDGQPGDAMNAGGVDGLGQGHRRQDGGSAAGQRHGEGPMQSGETPCQGSSSGRSSPVVWVSNLISAETGRVCVRAPVEATTPCTAAKAEARVGTWGAPSHHSSNPTLVTPAGVMGCAQ